jgi:DNA-binding XRE family transcriptional regulator
LIEAIGEASIRPTFTPKQMKAARELLGWSQTDVAHRVGLTEWVIGFLSAASV